MPDGEKSGASEGASNGYTTLPAHSASVSIVGPQTIRIEDIRAGVC